MKYQEPETLGEQLRRNAATLVIALVCLVGVTTAALKPPTEELERFSQQLTAERARLETTVFEDNKALVNNQLQLQETQEKLRQTEKALADNIDSLRQAQTELEDLSSTKKMDSPVPKPVAAPPLTKNALRNELKTVRAAFVEAYKKLQSDIEAYKINAQGLAMEQKSLDEVSNSLRVEKGEISAAKAEALKKSWEEYLPHQIRLAEIKQDSSSQDPEKTLLAIVDEAVASEDILAMQKALGQETRELNRTVVQIRSVEVDIGTCQTETLALQHAVLDRQTEIIAFRNKKS